MKTDELELVLAIDRKLPHTVGAYTAADTIKRLLSCGRKARRLAELQCNEPLPQAYFDAELRVLQRRVARLLRQAGVVHWKVEISGDPRCSCLTVGDFRL